MRGLLFLGGQIQKTARLKKFTRGNVFSVAADSGAGNALKLNVMPAAIVGDFDSIDAQTLKKCKHSEQIRYPKDKDQSDGELALAFLLSKKPTEILILGALGKRLDHMLANLSLLAQIPPKISAKIVDGKGDVYYVRKSFHLMGKKGDMVSVLSAPDRPARIKTTGLLYPLNHQILRPGAHGLSNRMTHPCVSIRVSAGAVFVFHYI